ncbi:hypothetical protein [Aurantibacter sp.]|uniref:hypothetical protein n=1 Tax=Aurantibacter sp. TaxID=2807103 RepID=UPI003265B0C3
MKLLALFFCILSLPLFPPSLEELRKTFPLANDNVEITDKMHESLSTITTKDKAILIAYKGAFSTLKSKHSKQIKDKKTYFKDGVALIELAIERDANNIEIRCLRLGVQENTPKFLKYKSDIPADKQYILDHFKSENSQEIKNFIKGYIQQSKTFNEAEKQLF